MGWLRQLKESYWQPTQVDQLDSKLEPLRLSDTSAAQQSPIERFVEVERDLGRLTLVTQALVEACVRKGLLSHDEIAEIIGAVDLTQPVDTRWGAAATERPSMPLALLSNGHSSGMSRPSSAGGSVGVIDDFENADAWGNDDEPTEVEGETALATTDAGYDFGGGEIDASSAIEVGKEPGEGGVADIPRTAPFPKPKPRKKQSSSAMRQIIGMALSGVIGLGMGYFILLWFAGQDVINKAHLLPQWMVPAKFHSGASASPSAPSMKNDALANAPLGGTKPPASEFPTTSMDLSKIQGAGQNGGRVNELELANEPVSNNTGANDPTGFVDPADDPLNTTVAPPTIEPRAPKAVPKETDTPEVTVPSPVADPTATPETTGEPATPATEEPTAEEPASETPATEEPGASFEPKQFVVKDAVAVDGETLGTANKEANLASDDLKAGSLTDNAAKKTKLSAFQKFCDLAKAVTFVDGDPAKEQLETRILTAEKVASLAAEEEATFKDVSEIAHQWIFRLPADRRPTSGVFLTGIVKDVQPAGELKLATIDLGGDRIVNVVTPKDADVIVTDRVAVLGVIVEAPAAELTGYAGPEDKAVWSEHVIKAEAPITPLE